MQNALTKQILKFLILKRMKKFTHQRVPVKANSWEREINIKYNKQLPLEQTGSVRKQIQLMWMNCKELFTILNLSLPHSRQVLQRFNLHLDITQMSRQLSELDLFQSRTINQITIVLEPPMLMEILLVQVQAIMDL